MKNGNHRPHVSRKSGRARRWTRAAYLTLLFVALAAGAGLAGRAPVGAQSRARQQPRTARLADARPEVQEQNSGQISASARQQIAALVAEKRGRTPAQRKMDSRLIYAAKMARGEEVAPGVETLQTNLPAAASGGVIIDITADVDRGLLGRLESLGATILVAHPQLRSVRVEVALDRVEAIAGLRDVIHVRPMDEAIVWRQGEAGGDRLGAPKASLPSFDPERLSVMRPDLETRRDKVVKQLAAALGDFETNAYSVGVNGVRKSEADTTHRANVARNTYGFDGTGVKIGVLSDGVRALAAAQAAGDVGPVTVLPGQSGTAAGHCAPNASCDEGTAMLELVHDIAPGAQLFFATAFGGQANFANNIRALRTAGCDIIIDDVFYFAESPFQDGQAPGVVSPNNQGIVTQAVNDVTADGALYFSSAGNSGNKNDGTSGVWEGDFVDGGDAPTVVGGAAAGRIHQFPADGATPAQTFNTTAAGATSGPFTVNWADPLGASANDYDLYILNSAGTAVLASSTTDQNGDDDPIEFINATGGAGLRMVIVKMSGDPRYLRLSTSRGRLTVNTPGHTSGHACAADAFGVAATPAFNPPGPFPNPHNSTNQVETFSSDGPRKLFFQPDGTPYTPGNFSSAGGINRQKPDITAADQASVTGAGGFPIVFGGTSAAAPNAGAIAALLRSANPALTPAQVRNALQSTAIDIEAPGTDRDAGHGIVMADSAMATLGLPASAANVTVGTVVADAVGGNSNGFIEPGERGTLAVQLVNGGNAAATSVTATLSTTTPNVFITPPATRSYPDIAASGGTSSSATPFEFVLREGATYGVTIDFVLTVTYNGTTRTFPFMVPTGRLANISTTLDTTAPPAPPEADSVTTATQTGRLAFTFPISTCGTAKANPGTTSTLPRRYDSYTFTNTSTSTICVSVLFTHSNTALLHAAAYVPSFNPATPGVNYVADAGGSTGSGAGTAQLFSFNVAAGTSFTVVVSESNQNGGLNVPYNLRVTGLPAEAVPANAGPAITATSPLTTAEDTPLVFSAANSNAITVADADAGSNPLKVTLQVTNGTLTLDGTAGLTFTTGDGATDSSMVFTGSAADINAALDGATFTPAPDYSGPASVQIDVDDQGFTGTGGALTDSETVSINVTAVNDLSVSDVTQAEGNSGTTPFTFNVTLESPAGPGGVTFDIATADGTATAGSDYVAKALTGQTIPAGSDTYQFTVEVNGDTTQEPNETFFVNVTNITGAQARDAQGLGTILNDDGAPGAGQILISEFRLRGPGADPAAQASNEFVEIYNATDSDFIVADRAPVAVGTAGWAIVSSEAPLTPKYVIPAGTVIPARGHFLVTGGGYSLSSYAAADAPGGSPAVFFADIPDGAGLALFRTGTPLAGSEPAGDILDRVGFRVSGLPYFEGTGLTPQGGITAPAEHSFVRKMTTGDSQDTDNNEADFDFVSTDGNVYNGRQSTLGAPGPENTGSPVVRNSQFGGFLLDSSLPSSAAPNRTRDLTSDPANDAEFGTMTIRRRFTNNTGAAVTRLRFRVVIITGHPVTDPANADLRVRTSSDENGVAVNGDSATCAPAAAPCTVTVRGTVLEAPSVANNGGLNSSLSVGAVTPPVAALAAEPSVNLSRKSPLLSSGKWRPETPQLSDDVILAAPLPSGDSINVQFVFGIQKTGKYRFFINVEALP